MKKLLLIILIFFILIVSISIYFLDKYYFIPPIEYKRDLIIRSDSYGEGFFAANRSGRRLHNGIDLLAEIGTPVLASRTGMVITATSRRGMGNYVVLRHPGNISTIYGHLSRICVAKGNIVRQGDMIGRVGKTGNAGYKGILPHLHFEVRKNGVPEDPMEYLPQW